MLAHHAVRSFPHFTANQSALSTCAAFRRFASIVSKTCRNSAKPSIVSDFVKAGFCFFSASPSQTVFANAFTSLSGGGTYSIFDALRFELLTSPYLEYWSIARRWYINHPKRDNAIVSQLRLRTARVLQFALSNIDTAPLDFQAVRQTGTVGNSINAFATSEMPKTSRVIAKCTPRGGKDGLLSEHPVCRAGCFLCVLER